MRLVFGSMGKSASVSRAHGEHLIAKFQDAGRYTKEFRPPSSIAVQQLASSRGAPQMKVVTAAFQGDGDGAFTRRCEFIIGLPNRRIHVLHLGPPSARLRQIRRGASGANFNVIELPDFPRPALQGIPTYARAASKSLRDADVAVAFTELELLIFEIAFRSTTNRCSRIFIPRASAAEKCKLDAHLSPFLMRRATKRLTAFTLDKITRLANTWSCAVVQTPFQRDQLRERCSSLPIFVVPNNINPSWVSTDEMVESAEGDGITERVRALITQETTILSIANQYYRPKGIDKLLDSLQYLPREIPWQAVLVGDGPDVGIVRRQIMARGLSGRVHQVGRIPNASRLTRHQPIVVSFARIDDCPNVLLEALYHRCPILASDFPAHRFLLGERFPGLVPPDVTKITEKLMELMTKSETRAVLVNEQEASRRRFDFDWQAVIADIVSRAAAKNITAEVSH